MLLNDARRHGCLPLRCRGRCDGKMPRCACASNADPSAGRCAHMMRRSRGQSRRNILRRTADASRQDAPFFIECLIDAVCAASTRLSTPRDMMRCWRPQHMPSMRPRQAEPMVWGKRHGERAADACRRMFCTGLSGTDIHALSESCAMARFMLNIPRLPPNHPSRRRSSSERYARRALSDFSTLMPPIAVFHFLPLFLMRHRYAADAHGVCRAIAIFQVFRCASMPRGRMFHTRADAQRATPMSRSYLRTICAGRSIATR